MSALPISSLRTNTFFIPANLFALAQNSLGDVIPVKAGIQRDAPLDARFRRSRPSPSDLPTFCTRSRGSLRPPLAKRTCSSSVGPLYVIRKCAAA